METIEQQLKKAQSRSRELRAAGHAVAARYDETSARIVVSLNTGVEIAFPAALAEGLSEATPGELAEIEISPAGLGLHWPRIDADVYIPALLEDVFGSKRWMAQQMGRAGGQSKSSAKQVAARDNGRKGGRPKKQTANG